MSKVTDLLRGLDCLTFHIRSVKVYSSAEKALIEAYDNRMLNKHDFVLLLNWFFVEKTIYEPISVGSIYQIKVRLGNDQSKAARVLGVLRILLSELDNMGDHGLCYLMGQQQRRLYISEVDYELAHDYIRANGINFNGYNWTPVWTEPRKLWLLDHIQKLSNDENTAAITPSND